MGKHSKGREPERKKRLVFWIIAAVIIIILLLCLRCCGKDGGSTPEQGAPETTAPGLDFIPADDEAPRMIQIPATTGIYMRAGQLEQTVDFYNPEDNNCFFVLSLYLSDNTLLYKSDMLSPGERVTDITLSVPLERGIYRNCKLHKYSVKLSKQFESVLFVAYNINRESKNRIKVR